jgi:hypothetical protein
MNLAQHCIRSATAVSTLVLLTLAVGCSKPTETASMGTGATSTQSNGATSAAAASKLGDLSSFSSIATDVAAMVDKAIDRALSALRANTPNTVDCKNAMADLLRTFAALRGKS